jgi:phosphoglycerate dehydrogenase-like enzyme
VDQRLRVVVASPLAGELCDLVARVEPRIELVVDQALLPPMRWPGDHGGDPAFTRTAQQQSRFEELVDTADALYGLPDESPAALRRTVQANPKLRWVHTMPAGGGAQVKAASLSADQLERIAFTTSAGVHGANLAEFAVFGVLAGAKDLLRLLEHQAAREWPGRWCMRQVEEMTILVLGLGGIGRACASRFIGLGATVIGVSRSACDLPGLSSVIPPTELLDAIATADALVVTLPGTDATHHLVNAEVLRAAKPGCILVSVGRGTVIDEQALVGALESGSIGFAAMDVFEAEPLAPESPLWDMPNVLVSPHTAALNAAEDRRIAELFAENARRLLDGDRLINAVNTHEFY